MLKEVIGEVDFRNYQETGEIKIKTQSGKEVKIRKGFQSNIEVVDNYRVLRVCAHLVDTDIPEEDNLVAQVLQLRYNEKEFMKIANVS